jgi:hypothetical protein
MNSLPKYAALDYFLRFASKTRNANKVERRIGLIRRGEFLVALVASHALRALSL